MRLALGQRAAMIMRVISASGEIYKKLERMWRMFPEVLDKPMVEWKQHTSSCGYISTRESHLTPD
jgi:hypothetical protein